MTGLEALSRYAAMTPSLEWRLAVMRGEKRRLKALTTWVLVIALSCSAVIEPAYACRMVGGEELGRGGEAVGYRMAVVKSGKVSEEQN